MIARRPLVTIDLLYGRSTLPVSPPPGCVPTVIEKRVMPALAEPRAAVERALAEPVGGPALREAARGKRSACILICGVAHAETITTFHNAAFMAHPLAANCVLDGNPLHEEQLAIVSMLGGALALNTVIDDRRRPAFVNFGEIVQSHLRAVDFAGAYARVPVGRRFQTVVTSAAGYPLDNTYYPTVKSMARHRDPRVAFVPEGPYVVPVQERA